jgi:hypothetical protein
MSLTDVDVNRAFAKEGGPARFGFAKQVRPTIASNRRRFYGLLANAAWGR